MNGLPSKVLALVDFVFFVFGAKTEGRGVRWVFFKATGGSHPTFYTLKQ